MAKSFLKARSISLYLLGSCLFACRPAVEPVSPLFSEEVTFTDGSRASIALNLPAGTPALIRIERFGAELESLLLHDDDSVISQVRLPYLRSGVEYHWLDAAAEPQSLQLHLEPIHSIRDASAMVDVFAMAEDSRAARRLAEAYRLYARATQAEPSEAPDLWEPRVAQLERAAALFARVGRTEERLWAEYLAAYYTYFPLYRFQEAATRSREIRDRAKKAGHPIVELMATQLEAQALLEPDDSRTHEETLVAAARAQRLLGEVSDEAEQLGLPFERAWAINNRGIGFFYQGLYEPALEQYTQALQLAMELQDDYLVRLIGGNVALARASRGDLDGALRELLDIKMILEQRDSPSELAHTLAEIGRLYRSLFMFPEAVEALAQAMDLSSAVGTPEGTGRIALDLAKVYFAMGQPERAAQILPRAIDDMRAASHRQGLYEAYALQADISRLQGDHEIMAKQREIQQQFLSNERDRAEFVYEQGMDALARNELQRAAERFAASHQATINSDDRRLEMLARLKVCLHAEFRQPRTVECDVGLLEADLELWLRQANPGKALDARFAFAQIQQQQGRREDALQSIGAVLDQMMIHRARLPGVLGAWYWESRSRVITAYLDLMLELDSSQSNATQALITLDLLRNFEVSELSGGTKNASRQLAENQQLRQLYARFIREDEAAARVELRQQIDRLLLAQDRAPNIAHISVDRVATDLGSLPAGVAYLTYYFSEREIWAWLGTQRGLSLVNLGDAASARALIVRINENLRVVGDTGLEAGLAELGARLLDPLGALPEIILLGTTGELASLPFESLRTDGRYLALDHQVVNVLSLRGIGSYRADDWTVDDWRSVWLAGAPAAPEGGGTSLPAAQRELADLQRLFAGLEVQTLEGSELRRERFLDPEFKGANLVHIASHATLDFQYPEFSTIELSATAGVAGQLTPMDVRQLRMAADLVTLSACEGTGLNHFRFDSHLGFVPEFLHAGAGAVIASLWPVSDRDTRVFMAEFYRRLMAGEDIPGALAATKRLAMPKRRSQASVAWAAFQLYLD